MSNADFLVLGGGIAALNAATAIRERNKLADILMVSDEPILPYSRPMLSKSPLAGAPYGYPMQPKEWYDAQRIQFRSATTTNAMNLAAKTITLATGELITYDKCVYALGAAAGRPPIKGADNGQVVTIRTAQDMRTLKSLALGATKAVVIGGGVIGIEMAWELKKAGILVVILEIAETVMARVFEPKIANIIENTVRESGIEIITNVGIQEIVNESSMCVRLNTGVEIPADFIVLSAGIRPNIILAKEAGIDVQHSVVVDEHMRTSDPFVYACGDCAQLNDVNTGTWTQSQAQGYIAGANAAGDHLVYKNDPAPLHLNAADTALFAVGDLGKQPNNDYEMYLLKSTAKCNPWAVNMAGGSQGDSYCALYAVNSRITGAALIGDLSNMKKVHDAVREQKNIQCLLQEVGKYEKV